MRLPSDRCVICQKTIDDVGGKRIVSQKLRGIGLSKTHRGGGNPDYPYRSIKIPNSNQFLIVLGEVSIWTDKAIQRALSAINEGKQPWFCQVCGKRTCSACGAPLNQPVGSDILYDDGCSSHVPMIPCNLGCINPNCPTKNKEKE